MEPCICFYRSYLRCFGCQMRTFVLMVYLKRLFSSRFLIFSRFMFIVFASLGASVAVVIYLFIYLFVYLFIYLFMYFQSNLFRFRTSHQEKFCKIDVFKNFLIFTWKHQCQILLFNKVTGLQPETLKIETPTKMFSYEYCKNFKSTSL